MRILHTADWHLGKKLSHFSRFEEQQKVIEEICVIAEERNVDAVLIAGDLFDSCNPSNEALDLFYKSLKRLSNNGHRLVVAIAGNHDSADKIDAPDVLARECGIVLCGYPNAVIPKMELPTGLAIINSVPGYIEINLPKYDYPLRILLTPYANDLRLKQFLGIEDKHLRLNEILQENWTRIAEAFCDERGVNILLSHLYLMERGGPILEEPEGEKPINLGNADIVYSDIIPQQIQYTALGHLHRFQKIEGHNAPVVYSSSPLSYSFSEAAQTKYVVILDVQPNQPIAFKELPLSSGRKVLQEKFTDVANALRWLEDNPYTLVELTIETDTFLLAEDIRNLHKAHDGIIHIIPKIKTAVQSTKSAPNAELNDINTLFTAYFESKHGHAPNDEILTLFKEIINQENENA